VLRTIARLRHQAKLVGGNFLEKLLSEQYSRGRGPVSRLISGFSPEAEAMGIGQQIVVASSLLKKSTPEFYVNGEIEAEYLKLLLAGDELTGSGRIFSAQGVSVSFPTSMHQIGNRILKEAMPAPHLMKNPKYYYGLESMRFRKKQRMDEGVLLSTPWHHNFYHWMIEILPRLISYDRCPNLQSVPLIVPKSAPRFVAESLRLSGYESEVKFLKNGVYKFNTLHFLSTLAPTMEVSSDAVAWLNAKFIRRPSTLVAPRKIYISRRDAKIRFVSNEKKLLDVLSEFGFRIVTMSDFTLAEQIDLFRSAECIIGPHGAAFANLAFTNPGATFIEFFARGHYNPCFNRISAIRSLRYGFLIGDPTQFGGFSIDPDELRAVLAQAVDV